MKFTGTIEFISPIETIQGKDGKEHQKQYIILTDGKEKYPEKVKIDLFNKLERLDFLKEGTLVTAIFNSSVSEWNGKHYGSLNLFKIEPEGNDHVQEPQTPQKADMPAPSEDEGTGLPF